MYININTVKGKQALSVAGKEGGLGVMLRKRSAFLVSSGMLYKIEKKKIYIYI